MQHALEELVGEFEDWMKPGTKVEVRSRFDRSWGHGFEIAEVMDDGYRVRRMSDGSVLPVVFDKTDVRREKKKQGLWWY